jgi:hypothetical protein
MEEKSSEILRKKAEDSAPLKDHIDDENLSKVDDVKVKKVIDEEGKEVIVFQDPLYSREKRSIVNYTVYRGKWEFENLDDIDDNEGECAVRFKPIKDGSNFTIAFKSIKDRVEFMDSIYSDTEMKQRGTGMNLEKIANSNILKTTGGIIGAGILSYGLYKIFVKKEEKPE